MSDTEILQNDLEELWSELDIVFEMVQYLNQYLVDYDKKIEEIWEQDYQDMNSDPNHLLYVDINNTNAKRQFKKIMYNTQFYKKVIERKKEFLDLQTQINSEIYELEKELKIKN